MEREFPYDQWRDRRLALHENFGVTEAISAASIGVAEELEAAAIVSTTMSGWTAQQIARYRPRAPILAVSPSPYTQRRLSLVWGVDCILVPQFPNTDTLLTETADALRLHGFQPGDQVVITAGVPFGSSGQTNLIKVHTV
jgi:pyruvate kinase